MKKEGLKQQKLWVYLELKYPNWLHKKVDTGATTAMGQPQLQAPKKAKLKVKKSEKMPKKAKTMTIPCAKITTLAP